MGTELNAPKRNGNELEWEKQVTWIAGDVLECLCPWVLHSQASSSRVDNISSNARAWAHMQGNVQAPPSFLKRKLHADPAGDNQREPAQTKLPHPYSVFIRCPQGRAGTVMLIIMEVIMFPLVPLPSPPPFLALNASIPDLLFLRNGSMLCLHRSSSLTPLHPCDLDYSLFIYLFILAPRAKQCTLVY